MTKGYKKVRKYGYRTANKPRGKSRNKFECGHRGFGQYCHRCEQADSFQEKAVKSERLAADYLHKGDAKVSDDLQRDADWRRGEAKRLRLVPTEVGKFVA